MPSVSLPVRYNGTDATLRSASRSGYFNVWPSAGGSALRIMLPVWQAAREFPEHAATLTAIPDSTD